MTMHRSYHPHPDHDRLRWGRVLLLLLPWLLAAYVATGVYSVGPNERAVVRRCGRLLPAIQAPGLHVGFPWGVDRVTKVRMHELKRVGVWKTLTDRVVGRQSEPRQAELLTGDRNLILVSAVVQYEITDPGAFLFHVRDASPSSAASSGVDGLIENLAAAALSSAVSGMPVDDVLTVQRVAIQQKARSVVQGWLDRQEPGRDLGVRIVSVSLEDVRPPQEVAEAFRDVTSAKADGQRAVNEAESYANVLREQARGEVERIAQDAAASAYQVTEKARGDAERFTRIAAQLASGRELTLRRMILETMEEVLPRLRKIVLDGRAEKSVDLGVFEGEP
jgi:membrane protease subunit HflK